MNAEILGFIAGGLISLSLVPQLIKSWKSKSTQDLSIGWSLINLSGTFCWTTYGIVTSRISLIVMPSITLSLGLSILYLKIKYGMNKTKV